MPLVATASQILVIGPPAIFTLWISRSSAKASSSPSGENVKRQSAVRAGERSRRVAREVAQINPAHAVFDADKRERAAIGRPRQSRSRARRRQNHERVDAVRVQLRGWTHIKASRR